MLRIRFPVGCLALSVAGLAAWLLPLASAEELPAVPSTPPKAAANQANNRTDPAAVLTKVEEQQALGFARSHHPELADLLEKLKVGNPREFSKALQDLHRAEQRFAVMADQNPQRYPLDLGLWKVESRIRLSIAQMVMDGDGAHDESLKSLLSERRKLKIQLLQLERARAAERIVNLDRQLDQLQRDPEGDTEKDLARMKRNAGSQAKAVKNKQKPNDG